MAKVTGKKTIKGIITSGIEAGHTVDRILKAVAKDKPESKADASHVKYYAGQMKRGELITEEVYAKYANKVKPTGKIKAAEAKPKAKPAGKVKAAKAKAEAEPKGKIKAARKTRAAKKS
tara:strand:- start:523 stop:879 length:357 start_codon:yes stop_codon:yes gene_type:complete